MNFYPRRSFESLFAHPNYSRYNWREDEKASEEIWRIKDGNPRLTEGDEFVKHQETFQEIIRRIDLVEPGDDPLEFYGSF